MGQTFLGGKLKIFRLAQRHFSNSLHDFDDTWYSLHEFSVGVGEFLRLSPVVYPGSEEFVFLFGDDFGCLGAVEVLEGLAGAGVLDVRVLCY